MKLKCSTISLTTALIGVLIIRRCQWYMVQEIIVNPNASSAIRKVTFALAQYFIFERKTWNGYCEHRGVDPKSQACKCYNNLGSCFLVYTKKIS